MAIWKHRFLKVKQITGTLREAPQEFAEIAHRVVKLQAFKNSPLAVKGVSRLAE